MRVARPLVGCGRNAPRRDDKETTMSNNDNKNEQNAGKGQQGDKRPADNDRQPEQKEQGGGKQPGEGSKQDQSKQR